MYTVSAQQTHNDRSNGAKEETSIFKSHWHRKDPSSKGSFHQMGQSPKGPGIKLLISIKWKITLIRSLTNTAWSPLCAHRGCTGHPGSLLQPEQFLKKLRRILDGYVQKEKRLTWS